MLIPYFLSQPMLLLMRPAVVKLLAARAIPARYIQTLYIFSLWPGFANIFSEWTFEHRLYGDCISTLELSLTFLVDSVLIVIYN